MVYQNDSKYNGYLKSEEDCIISITAFSVMSMVGAMYAIANKQDLSDEVFEEIKRSGRPPKNLDEMNLIGKRGGYPSFLY